MYRVVLSMSFSTTTVSLGEAIISAHLKTLSDPLEMKSLVKQSNPNRTFLGIAMGR